MKIVHVITDTNRRGAQVFACDLSEALVRRGHESEVIALAPGLVGGLDLDVLSAKRKQLSSFRGVRQRMAAADVTVAHGSSTVVVCAVSGLGPGRRFVTRQISETRFWAGRWDRRIRVAGYLRLASGVVALAQSAAEDLVEILWVPRSQIRVIPNGVPAIGFGPATLSDTVEARAEFGLDPDATIVGYVGALAPEKGVAQAIEAVGALDGVQLLVLGDGPDRERLETLAARTPGRVVFAGSVSDPRRGFAAMDLVVLPSEGGDSMPAVLIEAGFCGLAAVTTSVGAIGDIVDDGVTGLVSAPGDHGAFRANLSALVNDDQRRREMGDRARQFCLDRFDIDVVAAQWEQMLGDVAVERGGTGRF